MEPETELEQPSMSSIQQRSDGVVPVMKCMVRVRTGLIGKMGTSTMRVKYPATRVSAPTTAAGVASVVNPSDVATAPDTLGCFLTCSFVKCAFSPWFQRLQVPHHLYCFPSCVLKWGASPLGDCLSLNADDDGGAL